MPLIIIMTAIIGLLVGGVINALADDLPHYRRPRLPHYPNGTPRPPTAWLGLSAFLTGQRAPANAPDARLPWRHPLAEVATAMVFVLVVVRIGQINAEELYINGTQSAFILFYSAAFILIFITDVEHHLILFSVIIPTTLIALIDAALTPTAPPYPVWSASAEPILIDALIGAGIGFGVFLLFYIGGFIYARVSAELRGQPFDDVAFGYGDVMLITLSGLILGWRELIFAIFITVFLGALGAVIFLILQRIRRREGGMLVALPYGPYIIIGTTIMMLFSEWVAVVLLNATYG